MSTSSPLRAVTSENVPFPLLRYSALSVRRLRGFFRKLGLNRLNYRWRFHVSAHTQQDVESHFHVQVDIDRAAILCRRIEPPLCHRLEGFLIESKAEALDDMDIRNRPVFVNNAFEAHRTANARLAGFVCELRLNAPKYRRGLYVAANVERNIGRLRWRRYRKSEQ